MRHIYFSIYRKMVGFGLGCLVALAAMSAYGQTYPQYPQQYPQYPGYGQDPYGNDNGYDNYSANSPFKTEVARIDASVYRAGKEPLPLTQVPRLNQGDVLKVKLSNEPVNGIMPEQSNWDWTLLIAFINPSKQHNKEQTLSEEIRLREKGWYNDFFFTVPYDSQPIIFIYPRSKYRKKILELIEKRPDDVRQMGEKIIEIGGAYAQVSSFLYQLQYMMSRPDYYNYYGDYGYGNSVSNSYIEQSIEGLARTFNLQMPNCWKQMAYNNNIVSRAQCVSKNIRLDDLNFSVGRMLSQGGLIALSQLRNSNPALSKWIALAAVAVDFIMRFTRKTAIRIIPAIASTPENPLYMQGNYYNGNYPNQYNRNYPVPGYVQAAQNTAAQNNLTPNTRVSLYANMQPNDNEFVTVYAFVPHKWQPNIDPEVFNIYEPQMTEPCLHAGKNILRNTDLRIEWLADTFSRNFKLALSDNNGWRKEYELRKNLGLNAWEAEITKEDIEAIPKSSLPLDAQIIGTRGFNQIESPKFKVSFSNGGIWEVRIRKSDNGKNRVDLRKISGDSKCSQNVIYKPAFGQPIIFPIVKDNNFINLSDNGDGISFELDSAISNSDTDTVQIQQYGGGLIQAIKPRQ